MMGGVETDLDGRTSVPGLFAAGEVACTRVHGANRLASNSLLEGLVFGARAGRAMARRVQEAELPRPFIGTARPGRPQCADPRNGRSRDSDADVADAWRCSATSGAFAMPSVCASGAGSGARGTPGEPARWTTKAGVAPASSSSQRSIANAALRREESRGGHFRTDFPSHDDLQWKIHVSDVRRPYDAP